MDLPIYLLLLYFCFSTVYAQDLQVTYTLNEEVVKDAFIGNIPNDLKLPPLSSSEVPRRYGIVAGEEYVRINETTGYLYSKVPLDREKLCGKKPANCTVDLEVMVQRTNHLRFIQVQLHITDLNDNTPEFPDPNIVKEISESAVIGTVIRLDSAVDPDFGPNSIDTYKISTPQPGSAVGNSVPYFRLDIIKNIDGTKIPQLELTRKLDREKTESYGLFLYAIDGGTPPLTGTASVLISVTDSNDNIPVFDPDSYVITVPENVKPGYIIMTLNAIDKDSGPNGKIHYSFPSFIDKVERAIFDLNESSGVLSVKGAGLNYENATIHHLTIEAKDSGSNPASAYATVTIKVEDVNDEAPIIDINLDLIESPDGKESGRTGPHSVLIKENTKIGTYIGFVTITDLDTGMNGNVSCRLKDSKNFELSPLDTKGNRYLIKTKGELDREEKRFHSIDIEAWDFGRPSLSSSATITVELYDENDNNPSFGRNHYTWMVSEDINPGSEVETLAADDADDGVNAQLTYSARPLLNNSVVPFAIDPKSGVVRFVDSAAPLDAENRTKPFMLEITATDKGVPPLSTKTILEIRIRDENDNAPIFKQSNYMFRIREDAKYGAYVGRISATDADVDNSTNGKITYSFEEKVTAFKIKPTTGQIYFNGKPEDLDREIRLSQPYLLTAIATDHGAEQLTDECSVEIYLIDVNDNKPIIEYPNVTKDISFLYIRPRNNGGSAKSRKTRRSIDDAPKHAGSAANSTTTSPISSKPKKTKRQSLKNVLLIGSSSSKTTRQPKSLPVVITKIRYRDPDEGENSRATFTMFGGNVDDYFAVDMLSGNVTLNVDTPKAIRKMKRGCHVIGVNVKNLGKPLQETTAWVNIYITDALPGTVNASKVMEECKSNSFYPKLLVPVDDLAEEIDWMLYAIIAGSVFALVLIILVILLIRYKCCCCDKKSRTYNCKNAADVHQDSGYTRGALQHAPSGTVNSRTSFYAEWTSSQMQIAQEKGELIPGEMSEGSVRSHNSGRDSGTGDSMPSDAYHTTGMGSGVYRHPNHPYQRPMHPYGLPHQPTHVYLPPQDEYPDEENRQLNRHYPPSSGMVFTSKCTKECRLYGHGDNCWMPDSLQRPPSRMASFKAVDEYDGDSLRYQNRAVTPSMYNRHADNMRYTNPPSNTPYYYDPGSKFDSNPALGQFSSFRDDNVPSDTGSPAHSQVAASNLSRQPSGNAGYRHNGYPNNQGQLNQPSYAQSPIPFNSASPTPFAGQPRGKAYVNLQGGGYDGNGIVPEEVHSSLSSTSSGNPHPANYPPQYYAQSHDSQQYPSHYTPQYHSYGGQGGHFSEQPHAYGTEPGYEENFAATNLLLSPADSEPDEYKRRFERQMKQHQMQSQPNYNNYSNQTETDGHHFLGNDGRSSDEAADETSTDKLSTIREELDADEVVAQIDGLLL